MDPLQRFGRIGRQVGPFRLGSFWAGCASSLLGRRGPILISPDVPTRAKPAAPIDRLWSLDESLAPRRSDPRRGGAGSWGVMMGVPPAAEARQITGGPSSSTVEPIQRGPVSPLDRSGSRDGSPPISRPGMRRMNVESTFLAH
ncbi:hypothetical protein THAOC_34255 [Thalassiosira oceanica]|uniref:Uncharacterized protein n=1 Tax=Thalassiosira oceanica TaxID=159749 RepID=K0RK19_THAOC|nr:hypothetical protein THAOC_34255 [Thalassiosira oceanica]|eukprot:EJK47052.1 hypothetical protein THAOC_34255 [Thalassiosira oceanica]